nr:MAG TPA: hypothetical protein [Caudoviricetes sp.]
MSGNKSAYYPTHEEDTFASVERARTYFKNKFNNQEILLYYAISI